MSTTFDRQRFVTELITLREASLLEVANLAEACVIAPEPPKLLGTPSQMVEAIFRAADRGEAIQIHGVDYAPAAPTPWDDRGPQVTELEAAAEREQMVTALLEFRYPEPGEDERAYCEEAVDHLVAALAGE